MSESKKYTLTDSLEDYIETIFYICRRKSFARISDIAVYSGVKKSSVTRAVQSLAEEGIIHYSKYSKVQLTEKGKDYASFIMQKYRVAYEFLHFVLGVDLVSADESAQKMKKALTPVVIEKMKLFLTLNMKQPLNVHADCQYNEMRCMFCVLSTHGQEHKVG